MAKLFIHEGGKDAVYEIFDDEVTIGRGAASSIQVADGHASKTHAVVRRLKGRWKLVDFESKNGTRVNGRFLNQRWLEQGDTISIGEALLRFDAEGVAAGAPRSRVGAVPAVPAYPVAPATAPVVPGVAARVPAIAPASAAAPRAVPPAARAPAAPARPPAPPAPASARASPVRRARDDEEVDEETGRRHRRRTGMSSATIAVLGLAGAAVAVILFFVIAGGGGLSRNQEVRKVAAALAQEQRYKEAVAYARQHGDPGGRDWHQLEGEIQTWETIGAAQPNMVRETAAHDRLHKQIQKVTVLRDGGYTPKNAPPESEVAEMLRQFLREYEGTAAAKAVMNAKDEPYKTFRAILQENAPTGQSADAVMTEVERDVMALVTGRRFGAAIERLEALQRSSQTTMQTEVAADVRKRVDARILRLRDEARRAFDEDLIAAKKVAPDNPNAARAKLKIMIENYGIPALVREAQAAHDAIR